MQELTGLRLVLSTKPDRVQARIRLHQEALALGLSSRGLPQVIGHEHVWAQLISVEDDSAMTLGRLEGRDEVVLAMKSLPGRTSVYTLNPVLPAGLLRAMARHAGVHVYNDRDDTLYASRSFLTLSVDPAGPRRILLPRRSDVYDAFTGQRLGRGVAEIEREFLAKETVIWRLV